ncbi:MAG: hypothetical protein ACK5NB_01530 [Flavobacteriaceae bacterium]
MDEENNKNSEPITVINNIENQQNGIGLAGFIIALVTLVIGWIPLIGCFSWVTWLLGLILSIIGVFKKPRGFAIAGIVISFIGIIVLIIIAAGFLTLGALGAASSSIQ